MSFLTKILVPLFLSVSLFADVNTSSILGKWSAKIDSAFVKVSLILHIAEEDGTLFATIDCPEKNALGTPVDEVAIEGNQIRFGIKSWKTSFKGTLDPKMRKISGKLSRGISYPVTFCYGEDKALIRPQEPKKPYHYLEHEVSFTNKAADITLAGTLTLPKGKGPFPAVVLVAGTGPMDRNESIHGHKPFLVLADHLTKQGIATLRFDKRGVGQSSGKIHDATIHDFASDVVAAVEYLKSDPKINAKLIGLIGHSEGGLVTPIAITKSKDVAFGVLLAAPGISGEKILKEQQGPLIQHADSVGEEQLQQEERLRNEVFTILKTESDLKKAEKKLETLFNKYLALLPNASDAEITALKKQLKTVNKPWFRLFLTHEPAKVLEKVEVPMLIVGAEKDLQVPPKHNLIAISKALEDGENSDYTVVKLPKLNHLFQTCATGASTEYVEIEETFAPSALNAISTWVVEKTTVIHKK